MHPVSFLETQLQKRILFLDGAMGTLIQTYRLTEQDYRGARFKTHFRDLKGNHDVLCLTQPQIISSIHNAYLEAGADIIETNTFNSTRVVQAEYGFTDHVFELNQTAAALARACCHPFTTKNPKKPRFVAGVVGPTHMMASMSPQVEQPAFRAVDFDSLVHAYSEAILGLMAGGADCLLVETVFDTLNCKAALFAIENCFLQEGRRLPVMVSVTITDASGRTLSGQTVEAFWNSIAHAKPMVVGLNCARGPKALLPYLEELSRIASTYVSIHPNAGLPNPLGEYDETPKEMASVLGEFAERGLLNVVGGCCGTTPEHIKAIIEAVKPYRSRIIPIIPKKCRLSGLEPLHIDSETLFVNVGERTNVTGSAQFAKLIRAGNFQEATLVAKQQVLQGAQIIDVNMDEGMLDSEKAMTEFLRTIAAEPDISRVPVMIDSSKWSVLEAGLKCLQGKGIVNSISLKEGEAAFIEQANKVKRYGAAVVVMAFDEQGQADTQARKIDICSRAYRILREQVGFLPEDIIFDPNAFAIATGIPEHARYGIDFIEATRIIKQTLPHVLISGGISNVSFSFRGNNPIREAIHSVFLYHAIRAGLSMGIVNAGQLTIYNDLSAELREAIEGVLFARYADAAERLIVCAQTVKNEGPISTVTEHTENKPLEVRLMDALIHGEERTLEKDLQEALGLYETPLAIIEGPLMKGMDGVGELFGQGKMFLPQVVKSARVMKRAVGYLTPLLESNKQAAIAKKRGKILLATVKGDVHDIGKNIVSIVLQCNHFEVIDLGVMIPCEKILNEAKEKGVDLIGLSGLITPSLEEMTRVAEEMERLNFKVPLLIGGATTSRIHTAVKISPKYGGSTVWVPDASRSVVVATQLMGAQKESFARETNEQYQTLRTQYASSASKTRPYVPLLAARENSIKTDWGNYSPPIPTFLGVQAFPTFSLEKLINYIDWTPFFQAWEMKGRYPQILTDLKTMEAAKPLWEDAQQLLQTLLQEKQLTAQGVVGFFPAQSVDETVLIYDSVATQASFKKRQSQPPLEKGQSLVPPLEKGQSLVPPFEKGQSLVPPFEKGQSLVPPFEKGGLGGIFKKVHFLRQQMQKIGRPNLCLADFIAPASSGVQDYIGFFAVTAGIGLSQLVEQYEKDRDDYRSILIKLISDRLAEAFAEYLHEEVRKTLWGYAPQEVCTIESLIAEAYQGIRPAPGYGACPDHSEKKIIFDLLDVTQHTGITLTEHFAMLPTASVCGYYFSHPASCYFGVGKVDRDQVLNYASQKGISVAEAEKWLVSVLAYDPAR